MGEEDGLLTPLNLSGSTDGGTGPALWEALAGFLLELTAKNRERPYLILLGDVVEFALSDPISAQRLFFDFLRYLAKDKELFQRIIYIPGNHDHRVWELAKNAQYVSYVNRKGYGVLKERPWNRTKCVALKDHHYVRPWFWERIEQESIDLGILYPNYCIFNEDTNCLLLLHHGHFLEPIYMLLSKLRSIIFGAPTPDSVEKLEEENHPWIEFLFSSFGFTGELGEDVETFYDMLQSAQKIEKLMFESGKRLADMLPFQSAKRRLLKKILPYILKFSVRFVYELAERYQEKETLSQKLLTNILWYINGPFRYQIAEELKESGYELDTFKRWVFIFGHTHKPFYKELDTYLSPFLELYNTGSFVVDAPYASWIYGAGLLVVNEMLDTCMITLKPSPLACSQRGNLILGKGPFFEDLKDIVQSAKSFTKLTEIYQREWEERAKLKRRVV